MYVAVKGGERAIANAHALLAKQGRGDLGLPRIERAAVAGQLGVLVARVMTEGSLYDPELAARAILQAQGDVLEAVTLVRSYRTTLPRFGYTLPVDTAGLPPQRRISAAFKDLPGGQQLGATFDYTHRLFTDRDTGGPRIDPAAGPAAGPRPEMPRVTDLLGASALIEPDHAPGTGTGDPEPADLTREPPVFPMSRAGRLQALARADEGFLLALGYSTQRGFGSTHPFAGEIRVGEVEVEFEAPELGFAVPLGRVEVTECQMINQFQGNADTPAQFTRGYGLAFGRGERKAMSMSLVDRALRASEFGERVVAPAQDEEFVISHSDNVQATGFVEHLKLPHYVDFQAELGLVRRLQAEFRERAAAGPGAAGPINPAPAGAVGVISGQARASADGTPAGRELTLTEAPA
ncbi:MULTISPECIES: carbon-phosphorus lyase complex subunit PhnI [unclassified Pseudofrankia]|uniref:carbon-phosphorus lyase complex subunit PhnI n=1 Tax=unclassified Pseudofrankia TaxID=2994372 RepID=UPI0009F1786B|nr:MULTISPECIES: carbon-phosphorus lyase complex subunit PhnI [unclassified Pseudofrankia]MDT3443078.1 carbon-phosphorus lyase complex subunit PhnI [Pseudofrankia sp. BMG5.37]